MAKPKEKEATICLRRRGLSIKEIAKRIGVSKSTISLWCRDIPLTSKQKEIIEKNALAAGHRGRMIGARMNHERKEKIVEFYKKDGINVIGKISQRDLFMAGLGLFWGEGVKSEASTLGFVNSDPKAILFMYSWFQETFGLRKDDFMPRIFINHIHRERIEDVLKFWANLLELPIEQFGTPVLLKIKNRKRYENHNSYYGVLNLKIRKSAQLKYRIWGLLSALKNKPM